MSETILPLLRKVKHLVWYCGDDGGKTEFNDVFKGPLPSLEIVKTASKLSFPLGLDPPKAMPSLKCLIIHDGEKSYSIDMKKNLENVSVFNKCEIICSADMKRMFYGKTIYIDFSAWNATLTEGLSTKNCLGCLAIYFCLFSHNSISCFGNIYGYNIFKMEHLITCER